MNVLIVDDEPQILKTVELAFKMQWPDAQVFTAENPSQALALLKKEGIDLILLEYKATRNGWFYTLSEDKGIFLIHYNNVNCMRGRYR